MKKSIFILILAFLSLVSVYEVFAQERTLLAKNEKIPAGIVSSYKTMYGKELANEAVQKYKGVYLVMSKNSTTEPLYYNSSYTDEDYFDTQGNLLAANYLIYTDKFSSEKREMLYPRITPMPNVITKKMTEFKQELEKNNKVKSWEYQFVYRFNQKTNKKIFILEANSEMKFSAKFNGTTDLILDEKGTVLLKKVVKNGNFEFFANNIKTTNANYFNLRDKMIVECTIKLETFVLFEANVPYMIKSVKSGKYLEIKDAKMDVGAMLIQNDKNNKTSQKFIFVPTNNPNEYVIMNINSKKMLAIQGESSDIVQVNKNENTYPQAWIVKQVSTSVFSLTRKQSQKVADVSEGSTEAGAKIWEYEWNDTDAQKWILEKSK